MKKTARVISFLMLGMLLSLSAPSRTHAMDVIELKVSTHLNTQHPVNQEVLIPWSKEIEKRSNGRVKFTWFFDGSLIKAEQGLNALKGGMVDMMAPLALWTVDAQFPVTTAIFMLFQLDSETHASQSFYDAYQQMPELREELKGMKIVGFASSGMTNLHMKGNLIKTTADFKGKRIWPGNGLGVEACKIWGAVPTFVKFADIYMSLQRGTLDGVIFSTPPLGQFRLTDMLDSHTICAFGLGAHAIAMSQAKWDSLPPDVQKIFEELSLPLSIAIGNKFGQMNEQIVQELKKRGDKVYVLSNKERAEWKASLQPVFDRQAAAITATGPNGAMVMNRIQAIVAQARNKQVTVTPDWRIVKK